jgi:predicted transcriptional regulator
MQKEIHIVFQVLNFIHGDECRSYDLTQSEQLLLIALAKHQGPKGLYPSYETLAKDIHLTRRHVMRVLKSLIEKDLLTCEKNEGRSNNYQIKLSTASDIHDTGDIKNAEEWCHPRHQGVSPTSPGGCHEGHQGGDTHVTQSVLYQSNYQSIYQSETDGLKNEQKKEEGGVDKKIHRSDYCPSNAQIKYAQSTNKDWTIVIIRYRELGKMEYATQESHDKVFTTFLDNSPMVALPPADFTAEEAWLDARERIERGVLSYPTQAQEMIVSVIGYMTIKDAQNRYEDPTYKRFVEFWESTRLSKTPSKVHNVRNSSGVGPSKSKIEYQGETFQKSEHDGLQNGNNGHIGNIIERFTRSVNA